VEIGRLYDETRQNSTSRDGGGKCTAHVVVFPQCQGATLAGESIAQ
jgi:hypothetical protein